MTGGSFNGKRGGRAALTGPSRHTSGLSGGGLNDSWGHDRRPPRRAQQAGAHTGDLSRSGEESAPAGLGRHCGVFHYRLRPDARKSHWSNRLDHS